jgi:hypothetical protein
MKKEKRGKSFPRPEKRGFVVDGEPTSRRGIFAIYASGRVCYLVRGRVLSFGALVTGEVGGVRLSQSDALHFARVSNYPRVAPRASETDPETRK